MFLLLCVSCYFRMDEDFVYITLLGPGFCWIPLYSVGLCSGSPSSHMGLVLSFCNLLLSFLGSVNSNLSSRTDLVPLPNRCPGEDSTSFLLHYEVFLLWLWEGNYSGLGRALVIWGPTAFHWFSSPLRTLLWHIFSAQISGGPLCRSQEFSLCSSSLFGVLPCSFEPPWLPWTAVCVSISQKDYLALLEFPLLVLSPGSCSGQSPGLALFVVLLSGIAVLHCLLSTVRRVLLRVCLVFWLFFLLLLFC